DIERDLKAYAQFRREWRGKSAASGSYDDLNQQTFYASYKRPGATSNGDNNRSPRYEYSEKDFENFYKTFKKRVSMDREYENAAARDPRLRHFRTQRSLHEHPAQKQAKDYYDTMEDRHRQSFKVAMFFGVVVITYKRSAIFKNTLWSVEFSNLPLSIHFPRYALENRKVTVDANHHNTQIDYKLLKI
uniref:Uncharacterized protein n=1 Tax=Romanomermis culicivorax TaxID=13658 RepID=A0A915IMF5_ROMCU